MTRYILKRLLMSLLVVVLASIVIFSIMYFIPGDPVKTMLGDSATAEELEAKREELGLTGGYIVRLGRFLYNTFIKFDLGVSYFYETPAIDELLNRFPRTLALGVACVIVDVVVAIPMGIWAALHNGRWQDMTCMAIALFGVSVPSFWFALMLIILFSVKLNWLPSMGIGSLKHYILPVLAGSISGIGGMSRQMRSGMLDVIKSDYVITARAKGVSERNVVLKHMLPNALIPVVTVVGGQFARVVGGTVIIEQIFSIPGVGTYMLQAVNSRDYPVVQGGVIFLSAATTLIILCTDIAYAFIDPRIKATYSGKGGR